MKKIMCVIGTRPEAIKMAPVIRELQSEQSLEMQLVSTAQHRQMLDQVLETFNIVPDLDLNIMSSDQTLYQSTSRALEGLGNVIQDQKPDMVLVQGDTNTVLAGSLAAHYSRIPSGHIEAGLRTSDPQFPFPEEMNRRLTSRVASLHFAPTSRAVNNLLSEGVDEKRVYLTGNTVVDAVKWIAENTQDRLPLLCRQIKDRGCRMILVTAHRRENLGEGLVRICNALLDTVNTYKDVEVVYPVHLNPAVQTTVHDILAEKDRIHLIKPSGYPEFIQLMRNACIILSDSGGVQEEAPTFGVPVLILRDVTERNEAVDSGVASLVGTSRNRIASEVSCLLDKKSSSEDYMNMTNPFGDGKAAVRIIRHVKEYFCDTPSAPAGSHHV